MFEGTNFCVFDSNSKNCKINLILSKNILAAKLLSSTLLFGAGFLMRRVCTYVCMYTYCICSSLYLSLSLFSLSFSLSLSDLSLSLSFSLSLSLSLISLHIYVHAAHYTTYIRT